MTNLDSLFLNRRGTGAGASVPPPVRGAARFFFLAYTHFAKLVGLNMLFLLFCIPVVTIPAALCGMNRVCILLVREGTASVWNDFITEFRSSLLKSLPPALLCAFLAADAALCVFMSMAVNAGLMLVLLAAAAVLAIAALLLGCSIYVLMPLVALKNGDILRDALFLIISEPKSDLLLVAVIGGGLTAAVLLLPYSVPVIAVLGPALLSLASCAILHEPIKMQILAQTNEITN